MLYIIKLNLIHNFYKTIKTKIIQKFIINILKEIFSKLL